MNKNMMKKTFILFLILLFFTFSLSGCYNVQNIDKLAYVVALGFDKGENDTLKMTFQISIPGSDSGSSEGGSSQSSNVVVNTIDCKTINSGLNLINSYISKKINLSHCKVVVFSEELASLGISEYIYTLLNNSEIRPNANVIISKCDAKMFIQNSKPTLEQLSAKYYEMASTSSEYTGYTTETKLGEFFSSLSDTFQEPYAILGNINNPQTQNPKTNTNGNRDSSFVAGETPIETEETNIEMMGIAVFSADKFVGELNGIETICQQIITNQLDSCIITIPSPFHENQNIDLSIRMNKQTKSTVDFVNNAPYITTKPNLSATILSMDKNSDYLDANNLQILENYAKSYLEQNISAFLYKTSVDYHTDICGFGKYAVSHFLYWKDWENYNWLANYRNSFFHVETTITIHSSRTILKS